MRKSNILSNWQPSSLDTANSMPEMMRAAAEHKLLPLFKALQYVTFQTANIPLTQGYKMNLRQLGFALNLYDGPLSISHHQLRRHVLADNGRSHEWSW